MKKLIATLSVLSMISMSAVPAALADGKGNDNGNHGFKGQQIKGHFEHNTNYNINLTDIKGHWAEKYILDLIKKGVLKGVDNSHFNPNSSVSRAEWSVMVSRYFGLSSTATAQDFGDVPVSAWEYPYVEAMKDYFDYYRDMNNKLQFHPNSAATRQDVTVTLVRVVTKLDPSIELMDQASADALLKAQFSDADQITEVLKPYVATAVKYGLIHGDGKGHFNPKQSLSRAEAATLLDMLLDTGIVVDDGGTVVVPPTTDGSHVTTLTTSDNAVVTGINNSTHVLTVKNGTTVATLKSDLSVDSGRGTAAVYTDSAKTTQAASTDAVTGTMVVVATAQDGTTKTVYAITLANPYRTVTSLTTNRTDLVTGIDNTNRVLTVTTGTNVQTLKNSLSVDGGKGTLAVYADNTKSTAPANSATVTTAMVVVATAEDGTTKSAYTIRLTDPLRTVTSLTTKNNAVVTSIDNTNHVVKAAADTTVQTLKNNVSVDGGLGTLAVYTTNTLTTQASGTAKLANTMVLVATAQDGVTKTVYTISVPTPARNVTTLTTNNTAVVTGIDNNFHAMTVAGGTLVGTLKNDLIVDGGKGSVEVYTDSTKTTVADEAAALANTMVVVATAEDGTTKATFTITL